MESCEMLVLMKGYSQIQIIYIRTLFSKAESLGSYMTLEYFHLKFCLDPMLITVEVHVCRNFSDDNLEMMEFRLCL